MSSLRLNPRSNKHRSLLRRQPSIGKSLANHADGLWRLSQLSRYAWCRFSVLCLAPQLLLAWAGSNVYDSEPLLPNTVAVIDIDSTIQYDGTTNSPDGLKQQLDVAADDSRIIAVVLRVNSGGGVATAG